MKTLLLCIVSVLLTTSIAADVRLRVDRNSPEESIGASLIEDDGAGIIALKNMKGKSARLLHFDSEGNVRTIVVPDLAVNHMRKLDGAMLFIAGARIRGGDAIYDRRIVRLRNGRYETVWEASSLPREHYGAEHTLDVSHDGKYWASALENRKGYRLAVGEVGKTEPLLTYDVTTESSVPMPSGFANDGFGVEFVSTTAPAVAVLWSARVHVFSGARNESPLLLVPEGGGSFLSYNVQTNTLWVNALPVLSAFDGSLFRTQNKSRGLQPSRVARFKNTTRAAVPLLNGDIVLHERVGNSGEVALLRSAQTSDAIDATPLLIAPLGIHGSVAVSPSGAAMLLLPEGPKSEIAILRQRP